MDLEQTVKDLQAQNAQFQQMLLTLAKGQEELKIVIRWPEPGRGFPISLRKFCWFTFCVCV